jgi:hypothetical protein
LKKTLKPSADTKKVLIKFFRPSKNNPSRDTVPLSKKLLRNQQRKQAYKIRKKYICSQPALIVLISKVPCMSACHAHYYLEGAHYLFFKAVLAYKLFNLKCRIGIIEYFLPLKISWKQLIKRSQLKMSQNNFLCCSEKKYSFPNWILFGLYSTVIFYLQKIHILSRKTPTSTAVPHDSCRLLPADRPEMTSSPATWRGGVCSALLDPSSTVPPTSR